jgi:hypothetical protein
MTSGPPSDLVVESGKRRLIVSASEGAFFVFAELGEDLFFNLLGDVSATEETEMVVGGQLSDVPVRHLVTKEQAVEAAQEFIRTDTVDVSSGAWERQQ